MKGLEEIKCECGVMLDGTFTLDNGFEVKIIEVEERSKTKTHWHPDKRIIISHNNNVIFNTNIISLPWGCGAQVMFGMGIRYDVTEIYLLEIIDDMKVIWEHIMSLYRKDGCGSIVCTLGKAYYNDLVNHFLIYLGFKEITEYPNWRHGQDGRYRQKMLQYITK